MEKPFLAIMKTEPDGRVAKFLDFEIEADALAHVEAFKDTYPDAFVVNHVGDILDLVCDKVAKTVEVVARPVPVILPSANELRLQDIEARLAALEAKG